MIIRERAGFGAKIVAGAAGIRRRNALAAGFAALTALLGFSTLFAFRIQSTFSEKTLEIFHHHVRQDDALWRLRRTLWLGANLARDYLVHPAPENGLAFNAKLQRMAEESRNHLKEIEALAPSIRALPELRARVEEFWKVLEGVPGTTKGLDASGRYEYIQREIVPRRNATGDVVREFAVADQQTLGQNERAFARSRRSSSQGLLAALGLALAGGIAVAVFSLVYAHGLERKATAQFLEVQHAKGELQQLSARLMDVQEEERTRLSRELHDEIGQMIATVRLEIARAEALIPDRSRELRQRLDRAQDLTSRAMQAVRDVCMLLRPALLDDLGLGPALQWQVEDFARRTGIHCDLQEQGLEGELPDAVKTCVYRVLQEALHNAEKHSNASAVSVQIDCRETGLDLTISDNGRGLPADHDKQPERVARFGIMGMRERAGQLHGVVGLTSSPGKGTRVTLRLPLSLNGATARTQEAHV